MSATSLAIRQKQIVVRTVCYIVGFVGLLVAYRHTPELGKGWVDAYSAIPALIAAKWSFRLVRRFIDSDHFNATCFGYLLLATGGLVSGLGRLLVAFYKLGLHTLPPDPGIPDQFFLWADIGVLVGLFVLIMGMLKSGLPRLFLETSIPAGSAALVAWHFVIYKSIAEVGFKSPLAHLHIEYQICDVIVLWLALSLAWMKLPEGRSKRCLPAIAVGIGMRVVAGAMAGYARVNDMTILYDAMVVIIAVGWLVFGSAAALQLWFGYEQGILPLKRGVSSPNDDEQTDTNTSLVQLLTPYIVATLASGAMIAHDYCQLGYVKSETFAVTYILMGLIVFRQVFTLIENRVLVNKMDESILEKSRLAERIRSFSDGLEEVVEQRAQQLGALHQLTKAVHTTQQVDEVLEAATRHTAQAMRSLTAAIWLREESPAKDAPAYCLSCIDANYTSDDIMRFVQCYIPKTRDEAYTVEIMSERVEGADEDEIVNEGPINVGEMLCAPMRFRNEVLGVIAVARECQLDGLHSGNTQDAFDQSDHDLLESIGIEVATALHHARQFAAAVDAADHDPVTNLFNHRAIHERLDEELALANAESLPLSVMMMDLNDFKLFNDTYGHPVGDQVLRLVAQGIREENPDAIAARYGGDEFLVLAPRTTSAQAREFAERLRQRLISEGFQNPLSDSGQTIPIAISFGVAMFPEDSTNRTELLAQADANLYKAKNSDTGIGLTNASQRVNKRLKTESSFGILDAMVTSVDNKDKYTRQHSEDVCKYALWLAQELRLSDETMRLIRIGAMLHDVGKIGVPAEILRKPGHLSDEEYEAIKQHPSLGAMIVGAVPGMEGIVDAVRYHHERWDGKGYPDKLAGTDIPMIGRIMAVADAFSAMTTNRTYRAGMDWGKAIGEISKGAGTQFDPLMARAFCNVVRWRLTVEGKSGDLDEIDFEDDMPLAA